MRRALGSTWSRSRHATATMLQSRMHSALRIRPSGGACCPAPCRPALPATCGSGRRSLTALAATSETGARASRCSWQSCHARTSAFRERNLAPRILVPRRGGDGEDGERGQHLAAAAAGAAAGRPGQGAQQVHPPNGGHVRATRLHGDGQEPSSAGQRALQRLRGAGVDHARARRAPLLQCALPLRPARHRAPARVRGFFVGVPMGHGPV